MCCVGRVVGVRCVVGWVFVIGRCVRVPVGRVVLSVGDVLVGEFVGVPVAVEGESVVPTIPGNTELSSDWSGLAMLLGKAEKRTSRAFVVVGLGELLALASTETDATETEVVRAPPAEEAAAAEETASEASAEVTWLYTELNMLSMSSSVPDADASCLAMMSGKAISSLCRLSTARRDAGFTLPGPLEDCVACARESRSSWALGEVREDPLGEAVAEADDTGIGSSSLGYTTSDG